MSSALGSLLFLIWNSSANASEIVGPLTTFNIQCSHVHVSSLRMRPSVWNVVTERPYTELIRDLREANLSLLKNNHPQLAVRLHSILSGEKALLILGEGRSNLLGFLIDQYLGLHPSSTMAAHLHAVDQVYLNESMNDSPYLSKYPFNYHGQYFQNFRVEDGRHFDEVWAPHSLGYLMTNISARETDATLTHILKQMNPSGILRIWPAFHDSEANALVRQLYRRGLISRHAWADLILNLQVPSQEKRLVRHQTEP